MSLLALIAPGPERLLLPQAGLALHVVQPPVQVAARHGEHDQGGNGDSGDGEQRPCPRGQTCAPAHRGGATAALRLLVQPGVSV